MSTDVTLLDRQRFEIKLGEYGVGAATMLSDPQILAATQDYRRMTGSRMMPLGKSDIRSKIDALYLRCKEANIKKGWNPAADSVAVETPPTEQAAPKAKPAKKKAAKKKATKKAAVKKKAK